MKKAILSIIFVMLFVFNGKAVFAGFYSDIANNISSLEGKLHSIELAGSEGTKNEINKLMGKDCLKDNLSMEEIEEIYAGSLLPIQKKISDSCKSSDGSIGVDSIKKIQNIISEYYVNTKGKAIVKAEQYKQIDEIGIYSDGIISNAKFDLIEDIKKIDEIVFSQPKTEYTGTKEFDLQGALANEVIAALAVNGSVYGNENNLNWGDTYGGSSGFPTPPTVRPPTISYPELENPTEGNSSDVYSQYVCPVDNSATSGLDKASLDLIVGDSGLLLPELEDNSTEDEDGPLGGTGDYPDSDSAESDTPPDETSSGNKYKKVNDNAVFPCNTYFCIDVKMIMSNQSLLGGGKITAIEDLIRRSNDHLKKFANTSLAQSKMSENNFELGLKDIKFPESFHVGIQIISKPVPILNVKNKDDEAKGREFIEDLQKKYYEAYGMDYNRKNDLSILNNVSKDRMIADNSQLGSVTNYQGLVKDFTAYENEKFKLGAEVNKLVYNSAKTSMIGNLELQFKELEIFNKSINDYARNLHKLIIKLGEIPQDKK